MRRGNARKELKENWHTDENRDTATNYFVLLSEIHSDVSFSRLFCEFINS
jgi:hypothetical protein